MSLKTNIFTGVTALALASTAATATAQEPFVVYGHTGLVIPASNLPKVTEAQKSKAQQVKTSNITWTITYQDTTSGFEDPTLGATRKATLAAVLEYIAGVINHPGAQIAMTVQVSDGIGGGVLARCGTLFSSAPGYDPGCAFLRIVQGNNRFSNEDMSLEVDFPTYNWNSDLSPPAFAEYDLYSVLLHEITHALGVLSLASSANGASYIPGVYSTWDNQLAQLSGNVKVWNQSTRAFQLAAGGLQQGDNTIGFMGNSSIAALGQTPRVYSPNPFSGSSISHWQLSSPIPATAVMRPSIANGVSNRTYQPFEIQALKDLGYTLAVSKVADWNLY